jgi:DNA-directed RNA polymerase specialized sigma24 family protein
VAVSSSEQESEFEAYVRGRAAALTRVAFLLTGDQQLAEDLVQQTLMQVAGVWRRVAAGDRHGRTPAGF